MDERILAFQASRFLRDKINKYKQIKEARRQLAVCNYLSGLVQRDIPSMVIKSKGFYHTCRCKCGNKVYESDNFCSKCGSRLEKEV